MRVVVKNAHSLISARRGLRLRLLIAGALLAGGATLLSSAAATAVVPVGQQTVGGSATATGAAPSGSSRSGSVSDDGRFVVFVSASPDLPAANGKDQVYLRDLQTGNVELVSAQPDGTPVDSAVSGVISGDGTWVAFVANGGGYVPGFDSGNHTQAYLWNRVTDTTVAVSAENADLTKGANGDVLSILALSKNGNRVAFTTAASLTGLATGGVRQLYVRDMATAVNPTALVSVQVDGVTPAAADVVAAALSADGRQAAFVTASTDMVAAPLANGSRLAYARDVTTLGALGAARMVSTDTTGALPANSSVSAVAVADTGAVAFETMASNIFAGATGRNIFFRPPVGPSVLVSHELNDVSKAAGQAASPSIDATGTHVAFDSSSAAIVSLPNPGGVQQVYVWNAADSVNTAVGVTPSGSWGNSDSGGAYLSGNAQFIAFQSIAGDLVPGYSVSDVRQVHVRNLAAAPPVTPTPAPTETSGGGGGAGERPALAKTGAGSDGVLPLALGGAALLLLAGAASVLVIRRRAKRTQR